MKRLIVEDSKFAQVTIARLFSETFPGSEIILANNGADGYSDFMRVSPDIIVTDLLMPHMGGQELIKKIRAMDQNVIIFTVTADVQQSTRDELAAYDIAAFINKPLDRKKTALIKQLVEDRLHA